MATEFACMMALTCAPGSFARLLDLAREVVDDGADAVAQSRERCEQSFADPSRPSSTAALQSLQLVAASLEDGVRNELQTQGLMAAADELHSAVAALLANPALIARWRAGRPLLNSL